jgi:hypothetical protein
MQPPRDPIRLPLRADGGGVGCQVARRRREDVDPFLPAAQNLLLAECGLHRLDGVEVAIFTQEQTPKFGAYCCHIAAVEEEFGHGVARRVHLLLLIE